MIENYNYHRDPRVRAAYVTKLFASLDEGTMTGIYSLDGEDVEVPFVYEVCGLCNGKAKVVNPSIDCNGITAEDFYEDPDFYDAYMSGSFDIACPECGGQRVVPTINREMIDPVLLEQIDKSIEEDRDFEQQCAMERAMGA